MESESSSTEEKSASRARQSTADASCSEPIADLKKNFAPSSEPFALPMSSAVLRSADVAPAAPHAVAFICALAFENCCEDAFSEAAAEEKRESSEKGGTAATADMESPTSLEESA